MKKLMEQTETYLMLICHENEIKYNNYTVSLMTEFLIERGETEFDDKNIVHFKRFLNERKQEATELIQNIIGYKL